MYMYLYTHIYVRVYLFSYICTYIYVDIHIYVYVFQYVYVRIYICIHMYIYMYIHICVFVYKHIHIYIFIFIYTYDYMYTTYMQIGMQSLCHSCQIKCVRCITHAWVLFKSNYFLKMFIWHKREIVRVGLNTCYYICVNTRTLKSGWRTSVSTYVYTNTRICIHVCRNVWFNSAPKVYH